MTSLLRLVEEHKYEELFLDSLFWDQGDLPQPLSFDLETENGGRETFTFENVAGFEGIRVFVCASLPTRAQQAKLAHLIGSRSTTHYLLIFHDGAARQIWRWPATVLRKGRSSIKLTSHEHIRGLSNPKLEKRLESIVLPQGQYLTVTAVLDRIQAAFDTETEDETRKASAQMVDLFEALQEAGLEENHISETLARILFVMFGDDTGMWGEGSGNLFERYIIEKTAQDGSDIAAKLNKLFLYLDTKPQRQGALSADGDAEFQGFKYVNGGIFSNPKPLPEQVGGGLQRCYLKG